MGKASQHVPIKWVTWTCPVCGQQRPKWFPASQRKPSSVECVTCHAIVHVYPTSATELDLYPDLYRQERR